ASRDVMNRSNCPSANPSAVESPSARRTRVAPSVTSKKPCSSRRGTVPDSIGMESCSPARAIAGNAPPRYHSASSAMTTFLARMGSPWVWGCVTDPRGPAHGTPIRDIDTRYVGYVSSNAKARSFFSSGPREVRLSDRLLLQHLPALDLLLERLAVHDLELDA